MSAKPVATEVNRVENFTQGCSIESNKGKNLNFTDILLRLAFDFPVLLILSFKKSLKSNFL